MNTKIRYMYRDASNYKACETAVVSGKLVREEIILYCDYETTGDPMFIPGEVGLPSPQHQLSGFPTEDDHVWCTLEEVESTEDAPTVQITARDLVKAFSKAKWDITEAMLKLGWNPFTI